MVDVGLTSSPISAFLEASKRGKERARRGGRDTLFAGMMEGFAVDQGPQTLFNSHSSLTPWPEKNAESKARGVLERGEESTKPEGERKEE